MILIPVENLKEGMVLGRSVFGENGELLLVAGFHVKAPIIKKLQEIHFGTVWIQEEGTEEVIPEETINEQVNLQAMAAVMDAAEVIGQGLQIREETIDEIEKKMKQTERFKNIIAIPKVQQSVNDIIDNILSSPGVVLNLSTIRSQKNFFYKHAVDVTVISLMIASRLRLSREELHDLGLGSILHDIGMTVIPEKITNKQGRLTYQEFNIIKEHTTYGYTILKENPGISPIAAHIAFQHHERQDGFGYPRKMKGNNLLPIKTLMPEKGYMHRFAEIVAVADAYDAMASPRPYAEQRSPEEIIKQLIIAAGTQLNKAIVDVLIGMIPIYPVGAFIKVTAAKSQNLLGAQGIVAKARDGYFDRPTIILLKDAKGIKMAPMKIDLMQYPDIKLQFLPLNPALQLDLA